MLAFWVSLVEIYDVESMQEFWGEEQGSTDDKLKLKKKPRIYYIYGFKKI